MVPRTGTYLPAFNVVDRFFNASFFCLNFFPGKVRQNRPRYGVRAFSFSPVFLKPLLVVLEPYAGRTIFGVCYAAHILPGIRAGI